MVTKGVRLPTHQAPVLSSRKIPGRLPTLDLVSERLISPRIPFTQIRRLGHVLGQFGILGGCGSPVVKVSNHGRHVMSWIPVPPKTRRVGQRCTLNLSRAETSSRWCGVRRGGASSGVVHVT
ncbi:hypothetical protein TNCV_3802121 [Trichonephila clavipes]|nr:hypothetical protein TNCV_3802121 [Trichonephila clavipes]